MPYFREPNNMSQLDPAMRPDNADSTASEQRDSFVIPSFSETTAGAQREPPWMSRLRESMARAARNSPWTSGIRESVAEILRSLPRRPLFRESTARLLRTPPLIPLFGESTARAQRGTPLTTNNVPSDTNDVCVVDDPAPPIIDLTLDAENLREDPRPSTSGEAVETQTNPSNSISIFLGSLESTLRTFNPYYLNQAKTRVFQVVQDVEFLQIFENNNLTPRDNGPNTAPTGSTPNTLSIILCKQLYYYSISFY
ncbi:unnamed protein product [Chrysodeixis includens]|uniref:Uncharacterized protein n=1 Tax=Chrysodeixis includens TaxID=689277 RepID=A0A9N8Q0W7_CHRIL|nr:unnamed protein product [Chrysodeixis includens]